MKEGTVVAVHRCRFVDFAPSAVTALAFPPLRLPSVKGKKKSTSSPKALPFGTIVVGRANGNIEICEWTGSEYDIQTPQAWVVRKTLPGPYPSKVESLALTIRYPYRLAEDEVPKTENLRLFSAGGGSDLIEWDIGQSCVKRTVGSQGGSIWSVCPNPASTLLALGCEDGSVRILSIEADGLQHLRRLDRVKSRILSIAWGPPVPRQTSNKTSEDAETESDDEDEDDWSDSWLVTGCSDSSLRKWDVSTGRVLDRMGTDKLRGERTLVWAVGVLGDGTIVSGDSMGMVKFWDSRTCTQLHSFQGHAADVLCLTISPEGTVVYTSGVDQKIIQFSHIKTARPDALTSLLSSPPSRWVLSSSRRMHSHDVRALAIWPPHTPLPASHKRQFPIDVPPILVSGGLDMSLVLKPVALPTSTVVKIQNPLVTSMSTTFEDSYHRRLTYSSGPYSTSALRLARQARLLLCARDTGLTVWRILRRSSSPGTDEEEPSADGGYERVLDIDLNVHTNVVTSAISDDGKWIAVSDWYEAKLFRLEEEGNGDLKPRRIRDFPSILAGELSSSESTGASSLVFSPDSTKLVVATSMSSYILVIDLGTGTPRVLRKFQQHRMRDIVLGKRVVRGRKEQEDVEMVDTENTDMAGKDAEKNAESSDSGSEEEENANVEPATVTRMAVSPDGQWLASTDDRCRTHVFNLDSVQHHCVLPSFPQPVHALAFTPSHPHTLVLALANNSLHVYDVEARAFPRWARAFSAALPQRFAHLHDSVLGVALDPAPPAGKRHALFWGATWLCKVVLDAPPGWCGFDKKRKRKSTVQPPPPETPGRGPGQDVQEDAHGGRNFKMITHYRPILFVEFMEPSELLVVERPLPDVLATLPPPYFKAKYGET
ncbi:YVTN repeat-like/Quino protein amine dehydrogenase [Obba rivulosa]|uniref:YVTN repeat-like/Quino protein amine dehydrogenase n=1 Tax=Obba rivulosa TaxID=1052685 RepID=A0A8E2DVY9_9APHY|nr:YVTN repeat-like/Quino protein amine dehydrogenase [Obba rivulosa]